MDRSDPSNARGYYDNSGVWHPYSLDGDTIENTYAPAGILPSSVSFRQAALAPVQRTFHTATNSDAGSEYPPNLGAPPQTYGAPLSGNFSAIPYPFAIPDDMRGHESSHMRRMSPPSHQTLQSPQGHATSPRQASPVLSSSAQPIDGYYQSLMSLPGVPSHTVPSRPNSYSPPSHPPPGPLSDSFVDGIHDRQRLSTASHGFPNPHSPPRTYAAPQMPAHTAVGSPQQGFGTLPDRGPEDPPGIGQSSGDNDNESEDGELEESSKYPGVMVRKSEKLGGRRPRKYQCSNCGKTLL